MYLHVFTCFYMFFSGIYMYLHDVFTIDTSHQKYLPKVPEMVLDAVWGGYSSVGSSFIAKKNNARRCPPMSCRFSHWNHWNPWCFFSCVPHGGRPAQVLSAPDTRLQRVRHFGARCSGAGDSCEDDAQKCPAGGGSMGYLSARAGRA